MPLVEPRILTPEQFLLTLLVRLAAIAVLATMLARFHRFRRILIFERRGWVDAEWGISELGRRAKLYRLTSAGKKQLAVETDTWRRFAEGVSRMLLS